ncbi:MAG: hypothetical protein JF609_07350 [Verrucomicrobia bacterium]|nr:hypothetical protein [Verrucomicrobiota bacterium]
MPVDFINGYGSDLPIRPASVRSAAPKPVTAMDSFDSTDALKTAQNQTSAARPEKVARASELLADPSYPSDKVLNRLASYLAARL